MKQFLINHLVEECGFTRDKLEKMTLSELEIIYVVWQNYKHTKNKICL